MNTAVLIILLICSTLVIIATLFCMLMNNVIKNVSNIKNNKKGNEKL